MLYESPSELLLAALGQALRRVHALRRVLHGDGEHTWLAVALPKRQLTLDPVPSELAVNAPLRLRGVLPEGSRSRAST